MTIFVNLQNKQYFKKLPNKTYTLVENIENRANLN